MSDDTVNQKRFERIQTIEAFETSERRDVANQLEIAWFLAT